MDKCPETLRFPPSHHFVVFLLNNVYIKKGLTHYIGMLYNAVYTKQQVQTSLEFSSSHLWKLRYKTSFLQHFPEIPQNNTRMSKLYYEV